MYAWRGRELLVRWHHLIVIAGGEGGGMGGDAVVEVRRDSIEVAVVGTPIVMGKVIKKTSQRS